MASPQSDEIFNAIQGQQVNFPFPVRRHTYTVGTFNAATGKFHYAVPIYHEKFDDPPREGGGHRPLRPPKTLTGGHIDSVNVWDVVLRFNVDHQQGDFVAEVEDVPAVSTANSSVEVPIGAANELSFTLSCAGKTFRSELPLEIERYMLGAGVFTLPALPVTIIYAPPVDKSQKNVSKWSVTNTTGNTTTVSFSSTNSQAITPEISDVDLIVGKLNNSSQVVGLLPSAEAKVISTALGFIAGALGSSSTTDTKGITVSSQHSVALSLTDQQTVTTNSANGGPGSGDLIYYLKNVKLAWFIQSAGALRVTVFGHDGIGVTSVGFLKTGGQTDLDAITVQAFLSLDPFVANGPSAALPATRYVYLDTIDINGGDITTVETHTVTTQDTMTTAVMETEVQNNKAGALRWADVGVTEDSTQSTITQSSIAKTAADTHTASNTVDLFAKADERYSVEIYCDVVFGTFAYRQLLSSPAPVLSGVVLTSAGHPASTQIVVMNNNGRKFTTRTDSAGRYAFHASTIKPGQSDLGSGGVNRSFMFTATGMKQDLLSA